MDPVAFACPRAHIRQLRPSANTNIICLQSFTMPQNQWSSSIHEYKLTLGHDDIENTYPERKIMIEIDCIGTGRQRWAVVRALLRACCLPPPDSLNQLIDPHSAYEERSPTSEHSWRRRNDRSKRSHHRRSPTSHRRRRHHRDESSPRSPPEQLTCGTGLACDCACACAFVREDARERRRPLRTCARSICVRLRHSVRLQSVAKLSRPPNAYLHRISNRPRRGRPVRAMAAQPPRPPPNNLLFSGPPPILPRVVLVPSIAALNYTTPDTSYDVVLDQSNHADDLGEINNVGVPTYDDLCCDEAEKHVFEKNPVQEQLCDTDIFLRRARSFDIADIYETNNNYELNDHVFRHRISEPDLSKYGLFVEAEISVQPLQPPPLVLNNPFYDGSYALTSNDYNDNVVMLPESYMAFEDSFVPTWDYKSEYVTNQNNNPGLHYDGLPLIPPNDPWSTYGNINTAFEYYTPQFEIPTQEGVQYMRLSDLEYAMPQYMSLPMIDQVTIREPCIVEDNKIEMETKQEQNVDNKSKLECIENDIQENKSSFAVENTSNPLINEKKNTSESINNRESSRSEESLIADISNDVTSSLAFMPSSKSSQQPCGIDDTSDDTSPCSTDYHEASALDLAQSLDELSCCDSTDFSQSRDEPSPISGDKLDEVQPVKFVNKGECNGPCLESLNPSTNLPLSQLPSIPIHDQIPVKLPPVPHNLPDSKSVNDNTTQNIKTFVASDVSSKSENLKQSAVKASKTTQPTPVNNVDTTNLPKTVKQHPQPPAVPPAWLAKTFTDNRKANAAQDVPQILIHNVEGDTKKQDKNTMTSTNNSVVANKPAMEPQPSCSYIPPVPAQPSQLKPDKLPKEVELKKIRNNNLKYNADRNF
ncbi:unnamed protein product, partial [Brenthis ino]